MFDIQSQCRCWCQSYPVPCCGGVSMHLRRTLTFLSFFLTAVGWTALGLHKLYHLWVLDAICLFHCLAKDLVALGFPSLYHQGILRRDNLLSSLLVRRFLRVVKDHGVALILLRLLFIGHLSSTTSRDNLFDSITFPLTILPRLGWHWNPRLCRVWWICLDKWSRWSNHAKLSESFSLVEISSLEPESDSCWNKSLSTRMLCAIHASVCVLFARVGGFVSWSSLSSLKISHWAFAEPRSFARYCHDSSELLVFMPRLDELQDLDCHWSSMLWVWGKTKLRDVIRMACLMFRDEFVAVWFGRCCSSELTWRVSSLVAPKRLMRNW